MLSYQDFFVTVTVEVPWPQMAFEQAHTQNDAVVLKKNFVAPQP